MSITIDLTTEERDTLAHYFASVCSENYYAWESGAVHLTAAQRVQRRRQMERDDCDMEWINDDSLPITVAQMERWLRSLRIVAPLAADRGNGLPEWVAFIERMSARCRAARARAKAKCPA